MSFNKRINSNETKYVLVEEKYLTKTFDSSLFCGQSYFNNDRAQIYLIFQSIYKTLTRFSGLKGTISECESEGLSNETFKPPDTANKTLLQNCYGININ